MEVKNGVRSLNQTAHIIHETKLWLKLGLRWGTLNGVHGPAGAAPSAFGGLGRSRSTVNSSEIRDSPYVFTPEEL